MKVCMDEGVYVWRCVCISVGSYKVKDVSSCGCMKVWMYDGGDVWR